MPITSARVVGQGSQRLCFPCAHCAAGDTLLDQVRLSHRLSADAERADVEIGEIENGVPLPSAMQFCDLNGDKCIPGGPNGSNPLSSSGESGANLSRAGIRLSRSRSHDRALGLEPRQLAPVRRQRRYIDALPVSLQSEPYSASPFVKHGAGG
jgi:hypothetical protein